MSRVVYVDILTLHVQRVDATLIQLLKAKFFSWLRSLWIKPRTIYFPKWVERTLAKTAGLLLKLSQLAVYQIEAVVSGEEAGEDHIKFHPMLLLFLYQVRVWILISLLVARLGLLRFEHDAD